MRARACRLALTFVVVASPLSAQPNLSRLVALGDGFPAGVVSNALVESHQTWSVPALLARQAAVQDFQQPLVSEPGLPTELTLVSLAPSVVIAPKSSTPGAAKNGALARSFDNLGIPGTTTRDLVARTTDFGGMHDLVLRGRGTAVTQAVALKPTLALLWVGNDELLGAVLRGRAIEGQTLTPVEDFRSSFQAIVTALRAGGTEVFAATVFDVTALPFATTVKPYVVDTASGELVKQNGAAVPLLGPSGPLPSGSLVTLVASAFIAKGDGVPTSVGGNGTPLADEVIIDPTERAQIRARVDDYNRVIRDVCQSAGARVVDLGSFYQALVGTGVWVGGVPVTNTFLTGGFWSYDGVHPTDLGYALLANEWIGALNGQGASIPLVSLAPYLGVTSAAGETPSFIPFRWTTEAQWALRDMFAPRSQ